MSSLSRRSLKQKNIARQCLEKGLQQEIDEWVQNRGLDEQDHYLARMAEYENEQIYDALSDTADYDDYIDEPPYYDEWDDRYDDNLDDDHEFTLQYTSYINLNVGTYYKDANNRTYLCCYIQYRKILVNVHTGHEVDIEVKDLQKVG